MIELKPPHTSYMAAALMGPLESRKKYIVKGIRHYHFPEFCYAEVYVMHVIDRRVMGIPTLHPHYCQQFFILIWIKH